MNGRDVLWKPGRVPPCLLGIAEPPPWYNGRLFRVIMDGNSEGRRGIDFSLLPFFLSPFLDLHALHIFFFPFFLAIFLLGVRAGKEAFAPLSPFGSMKVRALFTVPHEWIVLCWDWESEMGKL